MGTAASGKSIDDRMMMKAADDKSGCKRRSRRHNILRCPAPLLCLDDTSVTVVTVVIKAGSPRPRYQRPPPPLSKSSSSSSVSSTDSDCGEEDGRRDCLAAAGGRSACITGWAERRTALSGRHRASLPRRRRRPLALEDQLILRHGFVPANRPALPPVMTTKTTAVSRQKSEQRDAPVAGGQRHNYRRSLYGGRRQRGQWTRANNNQPLRVEGGRAAACGKSSGRRKGERQCRRGGRAKRRRITTTTKKKIAPLPRPPASRYTVLPPLLPLLQWQQWRQHGGAACGGAW